MTYLSCFTDLTYFAHLYYLPDHQLNFPLLYPWTSQLVSAILNPKTLRDSTESYKRIFQQGNLERLWPNRENLLIFVPRSLGGVKKQYHFYRKFSFSFSLTSHRIHIYINGEPSENEHQLGSNRKIAATLVILTETIYNRELFKQVLRTKNAQRNTQVIQW